MKRLLKLIIGSASSFFKRYFYIIRKNVYLCTTLINYFTLVRVKSFYY